MCDVRLYITFLIYITVVSILTIATISLKRGYLVTPEEIKNYDPKQILRSSRTQRKPQHLICFKQWTPAMVMEIICSAINLKRARGDPHAIRLDLLAGSKIMILQEVNQPVLNMVVSTAATMLGAFDVNIVDHLVWEHDYNGKVFSMMADAIFVSTATHMCVQRFADKSTVPVLCMMSRTHASVQSMATVMAIYEEFGTMKNINLAYLGPARPILNSYLLLCPMLGAHIKFKCCCNKNKVSPLLFKVSEKMCEDSHTKMQPVENIDDLLNKSCVVIAGPHTDKNEELKEFKITQADIDKNTKNSWIFFHSLPRGTEVDDDLFYSTRSRTFEAFNNMQFIAAALLARVVKGHMF